MARVPEVKACLFDMDGLLINTEDMYTVATNHVLAEYGKGTLPWSVKLQLQGRPGIEAAKVFLEWAQLPLTPDELFAKTSQYQEKLWTQTEFLPGALELLQGLHARGVPIALATSSLHSKYLQKTAHLRHGFDLFGSHIVTGDDPRVPPGRGKPAPDIWHVALESLNAERRAKSLPEVKSEETIVFEDGIPGVEGGQRANCWVVWVPHQEAAKLLGSPKMDEIIQAGPGERLGSLEEFNFARYSL